MTTNTIEPITAQHNTTTQGKPALEMFELESRKGVTRELTSTPTAAASTKKGSGSKSKQQQATASGGSGPASPATEGRAADFVEALAYSREHYVVMLGDMVDKPTDPKEVAKVGRWVGIHACCFFRAVDWVG